MQKAPSPVKTQTPKVSVNSFYSLIALGIIGNVPHAPVTSIMNSVTPFPQLLPRPLASRPILLPQQYLFRPYRQRTSSQASTLSTDPHFRSPTRSERHSIQVLYLP